MAESLIQPQGFARLNPASRIAMAAHAIVLGSADVNVVTGRLLDVSGSVARTPAAPGIPFNFRKNGWRATEAGPVIGTQTFVEFWLGYPGEAGVSGSGPGNNPPPAYVTGSSSNQIGIYTNRGTGYGTDGNADSWGMLAKWSDIQNNAQDVLTTGKLAMLVVVRRQSGMEFWRDGVLVRTLVQAPYSLPAQSLICGAFITADFWRTSSDTLLAGRAIIEPTEAEIKALSSNPWMLFDDWHVEDVDNASAVYTLTAGRGNFAVAGQQAGILASRQLPAGAAAVTLAGTAATVRASRRVAAAPGSYSLASADGMVRAVRRLLGDTSALYMAGGASILAAARRLPGTPGAIAASGAAANLLAGRRFTLQSAAFSTVAAPAVLVYTPKPGGQGPTYTLTGGAGAFLVSASAARLLLARRMVGTTGAFSAAGAPAALVMARRLSAETGAFAIATAAGSLRASRRLAAAPVSFSLAGSAVTLVYRPSDKPGPPTYTLTAVGGSLVVTGAAANLRASRRLVAAPGQVALTGAPANLTYSQQIVYARAPAGSGYTPRAAESQYRPTDAATTRPAAIQRNNR